MSSGEMNDIEQMSVKTAFLQWSTT